MVDRVQEFRMIVEHELIEEEIVADVEDVVNEAEPLSEKEGEHVIVDEAPGLTDHGGVDMLPRVTHMQSVVEVSPPPGLDVGRHQVATALAL